MITFYTEDNFARLKGKQRAVLHHHLTSRLSQSRLVPVAGRMSIPTAILSDAHCGALQFQINPQVKTLSQEAPASLMEAN